MTRFDAHPFRTAALFVATCTALAVGPVAWAYIPPSSFLVKTMVAKHSGIKGLRIRSTVTGLENEKPTAHQFKVVTWFTGSHGLLRSQAVDDKGQILYSVERREGTLSPLDTVLFDQKLANVVETLKSKGVPIRTEAELSRTESEEEKRSLETLSVARTGKNGAWVIGDRAKPESQLWIEKDSFLPLRLILNPQDDGGTDLQCENWRFNREFPYPRLITLVQHKKTAVLKDEATEVTVDSPDLATLGKLPPATNGFTDAGNALPGPIHDLIKIYFESVR